MARIWFARRAAAALVLALMLALLGLIAAGCGIQAGRGASTPEEAAVFDVVQNPVPGAAIDGGSVSVAQTVTFNGSRYVLVRYNRAWNDRDESCLDLREAHYTLTGGWQAGSGSGVCSERALDGGLASADPMGVSGGVTFPQDKNQPSLSHVLGRAVDPAIVKVRILWKDGQSQEVEVVNGTFVALRTGESELQLAVGVDAGGKDVFSIGR